MKPTIIIAVLLALTACQPADYAAEKVADGARRYCGLSQSGRQVVREKVAPYLAGIRVTIECPGDVET